MNSVCQNSENTVILKGVHFESINSFIQFKQNVIPFVSVSEFTYSERKTKFYIKYIRQTGHFHRIRTVWRNCLLQIT